jgi:pyruvate/2-oxoglutarate dehydrogenase complex dihydrolipoamide acyltransferase (E2) component
MAEERLDLGRVRELASRSAPHGFLSIYVDASTRGKGIRDASIELKNRLGELERNLAADGPPERLRALREALADLGSELAWLTDAAAPGRGRALFAPLGEGEPTRFSSQMTLPNRVVYEERPFVHPLLELLDEGRATGAVVAAEDETTIYEWRFGELEELTRLTTPESLEAPHERSGPVGAAPQPQASTPAREQRQARERDRALQLVRKAAAEAKRIGAERGWERFAVSGGERLTDPLAAELEGEGVRLVRDKRNLAGVGQNELAATLTELLAQDQREREAELLREVEEAAHTGRGTLGLSDVLGALNEGRVSHLVYDPHVRYVGSVGADGQLYPAGETPPGGEPTVAETRLTERLVERALATDARVFPVEGAAEKLSEAQGIGALLRW